MQQRGGVHRRARLLLPLLLVLAPPARAHAADDPWFGGDKMLHFGASAALAAGGYALGAALFDGQEARVATGVGIALGAGVAKEVADLTGAGHASWRDLAWDVAGTAVGLGLAFGADALFFASAPAGGPAGERAWVAGIGGRF